MAGIKKEIGKTKIGWVISAVMVVVLAFSNLWFFTRVETLQNQVADIEASRDGLQSQLTSLQSEFMMLNASYVTLKEDYNGLSLRFEELNVNYSNLTEIFGLLQRDYATLNEDYSSLLASYDSLANSYDTLSANYSTLLGTYQTVLEQYFALNILYLELETDYDTLENTYNVLLDQHETLLELWNEPLEYVVTPTWDEVIAWLETDHTDTITYDPEKFLCGDFSIMLIQHAKEMHWHMLFTVLEFDTYEENPTGEERHHGNYGHAFVAIFTAEGIVYIEPQTDFTWYIHPIGDNETHVEFSDWAFVNFDEEWFGHIFVQYYNRCERADVETTKVNDTSLAVGLPR